jgi:4-azaleucine resistance transporter AzlC
VSSPRREFIAGAAAELPILIGVIPWGLIYGVVAIGAGLPPAAALAMSSIVFAGSAQLIGAELLGGGVPGPVIVLTTLVVNLRHMLYSASVAPYLQHLSRRWKWVLAYLLTDEAYVVMISNYHRPTDLTYKHWFALGAGLMLWTSWQISTAAGIFLGGQIPASWSLDFTLALTFIGLLLPALGDRASVAAAAAAGLVALLAFDLPLKLGLIVAAGIGITAGLAVESLRKA